ncbi:MAG: phosphoribosylamine--glycine ligase [Candidatus Cloacimonetes bacterium HGW-Cloacimonetes-2]|nr:MAG: phosphoribosylamine--glycine ligase [Candidatus Cloacimonetes bacterium HGW-Cloacimonetes-2]
MNILIIGSGGREHAIADAFARSPKVKKIIVSPGNDGIGGIYECVKLCSHRDIADYCETSRIDLVFVGNEQPVEDGLTDFLRERGLRVVGPSQAAGRIETSKAFAKDLMQRHNVPSARYGKANSADEARSLIAEFGYPVVIKADGLSAGKGVYILEDSTAMEDALGALYSKTDKEGVIVEEFLSGWELSLFAITDGTDFCTTVFSQDHKQLYDNDMGPNTGGMGAVAPLEEGEAYREQIELEIIKPVIDAMREEAYPFCGVLYCGLMITREGPKVLEFNCRWGDPEAEAVLPLLKTDMVEICEAIIEGKISEIRLEWKPGCSVTLVLASRGYPAKPDTGYPIRISDPLESIISYAGVKAGSDCLVNNGGRVIMLTALGKDLMEARKIVYTDAQKIDFDGKYYRGDIGLRSNTFSIGLE